MKVFPVVFLVVAALSTASCDGDSANGGAADAGGQMLADGGPRDSGVGDSGGAGPDAGPADDGGGDDGPEDAGLLDAGRDAGTADGGADAGVVLPCKTHLFEETMIPARDGAALAALIRRPAEPACKVPAIFIYTPYNIDNVYKIWLEDTTTEPLFAGMDYAVVAVDWRGKFGSSSAQVRDELQYGEDGYDLVEWIAAQPWSDGNVGMYGVSALGRVQYWTAAEQPPHLKAAVPIFGHMNHFYENFFPGGVFRKEYAEGLGLLYGTGGTVKQHPCKDLYWRVVEGLHDPALVKIPMLVVSGWYDLFNRGTHRTFDEIRTLSDPSVRNSHRMLIGPWSHFAAGGEGIWGREFTEEERQWFDADRRIQKDALAFYDLYLRGLQSEAAGWPRVRYVQGAEGLWKSADEWPPPSEPGLLYLTGGRGLSDAIPSGGEIGLPCDPNDPSPTVGGQTLSWKYTHGPTDQAAVLARGDAAAFVTEPLAEPLRITGAVLVRLNVKTTGTDTDFAARLTDVDGNGRHLLLTDGIRRLKLRDDLSAPSDVTAGLAYSITIALTNELAYTFLPGHRVGVIITSSNYERFDRNPNTGDDFFEDAAAPLVVTNTILLGAESFLALPVIR
ncbi:MAG: CocE/NonD family hydrolase [Deltaproteobacteria bacterium]|nr:CocE/NonD family hydrolase [Deltaproteobacteria bacterium]